MTLLGVKMSQCSALTFAFPHSDLTDTWRLPTKATQSTSKLVSRTIEAVGDSPQTAICDLLRQKLALWLAETDTGATLEATDLPATIQKYLEPQEMPLRPDTLHGRLSNIVRTQAGLDKSSKDTVANLS